MVVVDEQMRVANMVTQRISDDKKDEVVRMYNGGAAISNIASACHVSRSSVYKIIKERTVTSCDKKVEGDLE